jgi:cellulose synthase/poly-beta-1,6-N-acetylglucosamine synthase-like glycosyltransferase
MKTIAEQIGMVEKKKQSVGLPKPFPSDAPSRMHKSYYNNNIDGIKKLYKEQGIELPNYFDSVDSYIDYRKSQKQYGGRVQPRRAQRSAETR